MKIKDFEVSGVWGSLRGVWAAYFPLKGGFAFSHGPLSDSCSRFSDHFPGTSRYLQVWGLEGV